MTSHVRIENQNGTLVGIDENGNEVPVDFNSIDTEQQNNNEVNLTRLVDDGTFADILDAIANADQAVPEGHRGVIEPGTYTVSTQRTLHYQNREIAPYGESTDWAGGASTLPVVIDWDGADTTVPLIIGDGSQSTKAEGVTFRNIGWINSGATANTAMKWGDGGGATVRDIVFDNCAFGTWQGDLFVEDANVNAFDFKFYRGFYRSDGTAKFPSQTVMRDCNLVAGNTTAPSFNVDDKSHLSGIIGATGPNGGILLQLNGNSVLSAKNIEGNTTSSGTAVVVDEAAGSPTRIEGTITNWDTIVRVDRGAIVANINAPNIGTWEIDFQGAGGDHNGSYGYVRNLSLMNVAASGGHRGFIAQRQMPASNAPSYPSMGYVVDLDPAGDGSIAPSIIWTDDVGTTHYWAQTGTNP